MEHQRSEQILQATMKTVLEHSQQIMFVKNMNLQYVGATQAFVDLVGLKCVDDIIGKTDAEIMPDPALAKRYRDDDLRLFARGKPMDRYMEPIPSFHGIKRYASTSKYIITDENGKAIGLFGMGVDITAGIESRRWYERELRYLLDTPDDALATLLIDVTDWRVIDTRLGAANNGTVADYGSVDDYIQAAANAVVEDEKARNTLLGFTQQAAMELYQGGEERPRCLVYRRRMPDGTIRWMEDKLHYLIDPVTSHMAMLVVLRDVDDETRTKKALVDAADTDAMTGLLNREATMRRIEQYLHTEGAAGTHALFMIDIDNFKNVNDTFGHQAGDRVLMDVAAAIRLNFRENDIIGRIGGDEFFVLMKHAEKRSAVIHRAQNMIEILQYAYASSQARVDLSGSIGISFYRGEGKTLKQLYAEADNAMYLAKQQGKNRFVLAEKAKQIDDGALPIDSAPIQAIQLRTLLEKVACIVCVYEIEQDQIRNVYTSPSVSSLLEGMSNRTDSRGRNFLDYIFSEDRTALENGLLKVAKHGDELELACRICIADGRITWWQIQCTGMQQNGNSQVIAVATNVTRLKRESHPELLHAATQVGVVSVLTDADLTLQYGNERFYELLGYTQQSFSEQHHAQLARLLLPGDLSMIHYKLSSASTLRNIEWILRLTAANGSIKQIKFIGERINEPGQPDVISGVIIDLSDALELETDPLTGLYQRNAFYANVRKRLQEAPDTRFVLLRYDIDRFKVYNEVYGTDAGDRLLAAIGREQLKNMHAGMVAGRIDADHFAVLLPKNDFRVEIWADKQAHWLERYSPDFHLTTSMGIYEITDPSIEVSSMCDRALLALRSVKNRYTNKIAWYNEQMRNQLFEAQMLANDMEVALREGQFLLYFQPQVNYESGDLIGAEALVRWQHPKLGMLMPGQFIPLFEKNGFIAKLDAYVWEESCRYIRRWMDHSEQLVPVSVSINISRYDIRNPDLCDRLYELVQRYQLPTSSLRLEITESAYLENPEVLKQFVSKIQYMGFLVEMDDFGSGYSSLTTLKEIPVDMLKLDMRFLTDSVNNVRAGSILSSVIRMAHWLKMPVIAEGVETQEQAEYLKNLNCLYMQGYFFGKPMSADSFEKILLQRHVDSSNPYQKIDLSNMDSFWNLTSQQAFLFNSYAGAACILEYSKAGIEMERANNSFYEELGVTREVFGDQLANVWEDLEADSRNCFLQTLKRAVENQEKVDCEIHCKPLLEGQGVLWLRCRMQALVQSTERCAVYVSIRNITAQKMSENTELQQYRSIHVENEFKHLLLKQFRSIIFHYNYGSDELICEKGQSEGGIASYRFEHYLERLSEDASIHPDSIASYRAAFDTAQKAPQQGMLAYSANYFGTGFSQYSGLYTSVADESGKVYGLVGIVFKSL